MKVLFVATVRSHIGQFHMPFIRELVRRGCRVEAAFKDNSADKPGLDLSGIARTYEVPFSRSPYSVDNLKAYQVLKKIIDEGRYDAIHCHTPMGAVVTRLAARDARKRGTKVIYTAHGFHFYNGAARKNWLLFYPVEKALAKDTDCLITINSEDYNTAKARQFAAGRLELVNGVGVDLSDFQPVTREQKLALRRAYGYSPDDFILIYPADFSARKNQNMLFDTLKLLLEKDKHFRLLLPGFRCGSQAVFGLCQIYRRGRSCGGAGLPAGYSSVGRGLAMCPCPPVGRRVCPSTWWRPWRWAIRW